jgi:hypothetical protein
LTYPEDRIGIRWKGSATFEHEQHRVFPKELLFEAVKGYNCVSLQDDEDPPEWIEKVPLHSWVQTMLEISKCKLVITSCTSVAHLAGAMGVPTWIVIPILPYYLWAVPGSKTDHYESVELFRQEVYGCWEAPFNRIREKLNVVCPR